MPRTTDSNRDEPIAPNRLAERAVPDGPNQVWLQDITYVPTQEGWLYLALVLDLWSRKIVGWAMADHLRSELVVDALDMAQTQRQPGRGLLVHSDRGVQYASRETRAFLADGAIVRRHLLIRGVQARFVTTGLDDRRLWIVGNRDPGHPTVKAAGMTVGRNPRRQLLMEERPSVDLVAGPSTATKIAAGDTEPSREL